MSLTSRLLATVLALGITTAHAQTTITEDRAAIRAARIAQTKALADGDLDTVVSYWTPDATFRRALGQPVNSAAEARQLLEPQDGGGSQITYQRESVDIEVSPQWPLAYEQGLWSGHQGDSSGPVIISGRYAAQWVKRDGQWLIRSEVFVALNCSEMGCEFEAVP